MRTNKKEEGIYTKELDEMDKYLLNIFKRYFEGDNNFLEESVESIITEAVRRSKKEILNYSKKFLKINNTCTANTLPPKPTTGDGPYFDLDSKKPIWFNGQSWIDAVGNIMYAGDN